MFYQYTNEAGFSSHLNLKKVTNIEPCPIEGQEKLGTLFHFDNHTQVLALEPMDHFFEV